MAPRRTEHESEEIAQVEESAQATPRTGAAAKFHISQAPRPQPTRGGWHAVANTPTGKIEAVASGENECWVLLNVKLVAQGYAGKATPAGPDPSLSTDYNVWCEANP